MNNTRRLAFALLFPLAFSLVSCDFAPQRAGKPHPKYQASQSKLIIRCDNQCDNVAQTIAASGGSVSQRYRQFKVLAATVPVSGIPGLNALVGPSAIFKDKLIPKPQPVNTRSVTGTPSAKAQFLAAHNINDTYLQLNQSRLASAMKVSALSRRQISTLATAKPADYDVNNQLTGASVLHEQGIVGEGVIVAVIDSGVANNPEVVPSLTDSVIGGENFVTTGGEPSATSTLNDSHGTWVGTMIAAHAAIILPIESEIAQAVVTYLPDAVQQASETEVQIPMVGTAPGAQLYALKTFGADGDGAPSSRILAAMDRALTLKINFDNGESTDPVAGDGTEEDPYIYDALNIRVVNMSLGGPTLFSGRELDEMITNTLLEAGITLVVSAGNEGYAAITGGSPGTGLGALAVGAASEPAHERVLRELQLGPGTGGVFRPLDELQVAHFSSRGPTADGRTGIEIIANGVASFVQGPDGELALVSGTSFSAPTVSGAAALLQSAVPDASASLIRNALVIGANPDLIGNRSAAVDQGYGFLDVPAALDALANADERLVLPTEPAAEPDTMVAPNLRRAGIQIANLNGPIHREVDLKPGEVSQIFIETGADVGSVFVEVTDVEPELPADAQNQMFGDDVILTVVDAPTSFDHTEVREFLAAPQQFEITNPQPGIMRIALMGDWTNIGEVSAEVKIWATEANNNGRTIATGSLIEGASQEYEVNVSQGTRSVEFKLAWSKNWAYYPAHDLDMILVDPTGEINFDGASLHSPETVLIDNPVAGTWQVIVEGFSLHDREDEFQLSVNRQGRRRSTRD